MILVGCLLARYTRRMSTLETINFDNQCLKRLPIDPEHRNYVRTVPGACFSRVKPTPLERPALVACSIDALQLLGLKESELERSELAEYFSGNQTLPGSETASHCYCGHQFGTFAGQLGDGTVCYLGEVVNGVGERWEVQLKGSGLTPYSRRGDGRKVLRSSIREFLCSEAMHYLGIPTTRAGTCVTSDTRVERDIRYDGHPKMERATVVSRIAQTFLRFGSFEIFKTRDLYSGRAGPSVGRVDMVHQLLDFTTEMYFPQIQSAHPEDRLARTASLFKEVARRTARLVAQWQCVGFCHGVLNTDNMSIVGVTIDYGPFGFMDRYDPGHVCNASDDGGRYAYDKQPSICRWNLQKLSEALSPCLSEGEAEAGLKMYDEEFQSVYLTTMRRKLGLQQVQDEEEDDSELIESLLDAMHQTGCDFTNCFRALSSIQLPGTRGDSSDFGDALRSILDQCSTPEEVVASAKPKMHPHLLLVSHFEDMGWVSDYTSPCNLHMLLALARETPQVLAQLGISMAMLQKEQEEMQNVEKLKTMSSDEKRQRDEKVWRQWLTLYKKRLEKESVGVSQEQLVKVNEDRVKVMNSSNPKFVLRNHIVQQAIETAEEGDYSEVRRLLWLLKHPYNESVDLSAHSIADPPSSVAEKVPATVATSLDEGSTVQEREEEVVLSTSASAGLQKNQGGYQALLQRYCSRPPMSAVGIVVS